MGLFKMNSLPFVGRIIPILAESILKKNEHKEVSAYYSNCFTNRSAQ